MQFATRAMAIATAPRLNQEVVMRRVERPVAPQPPTSRAVTPSMAAWNHGQTSVPMPLQHHGGMRPALWCDTALDRQLR
jgi:hypothetical protein